METPTWVYHKTEAAKIVSAAEAKELYKQGWADSPARVNDAETESAPSNKRTKKA